MRRIVVTPAGRERYLDILYRHLDKQKTSFDEWILLVNTSVPRDIEYCERLAATHDWIRTAYADGSDPSIGNRNIHKFLNQFCRDGDAMYLRLDDDVCYLAPGFVDNMFEFRQTHPEYFLVYANIINNAILSCIHQELGNFTYHRQCGYKCMDDVGWKDTFFAPVLHDAFLENPTDPKWTSFEPRVADKYERISINAICWFGKDLREPVDQDEEQWLSVEYPFKIKRHNIINSKALCVHFAFHPQRDELERIGNRLERYAELANKSC